VTDGLYIIFSQDFNPWSSKHTVKRVKNL